MVTETLAEQPDSARLQAGPSPRPVSVGARGAALPLALVIVLAFTAAYVSFVLTVYHLSQGRRATGVYELMCGRQGAGCQEVLQTRYGYFGNTNIPVAAMGLAYFASLGFWYLVVGAANRRGRWWHLVPLILNLGGVGWSVSFTWIMVAVLREICWWCLTAHVINGLMLVLAFVLWPRSGLSAGPAKPSLRLALGGLLLVAAVFMVTLLSVSTAQWRRVAMASSKLAKRYRNDPGLMAYAYHRREKVDLPLRPDDPVLGDAGAEHLVVVFSDFRCGACTKLAVMLRDEVLPAYAGHLRVVFKHYPLDNSCNPRAKWGRSFNSCAAAQAAEAARNLQGSAGFWKMHDQLFEHRKELAGEPDFKALAEAVGLDGRDIAEAVRGRAYRERIAQDIELAARLGLTGTPTVFLDGKRLTEWHRLAMWRAILSPEEPGDRDQEAEPFEILEF